MNKNLISYKNLYYLSLIPFLGFFIAWICSWTNIYHRTKDRKYIFLHFIIWIVPICIASGIIVIVMITLMVNISPSMYKIYGLIVSYVACLIMSISCVGISKGIINRYDLKSIQ